MNTKHMLEIIRDISAWKGDVFNLAVTIAAEQREEDAVKAESLDAIEVATLIRAEV